MNSWTNNRKIFLLAGLWLLLGVIAQTNYWRYWENKLFDFLTIVTTPDEVSGMPIVIVGIDEPSFAELQQQWPWPRSLHAKLVHQLQQAGASVIAFDVVFADPSDPQQDQSFADAIAKAGNVVLAADYAIYQRKLYAETIRVEPLPLLLEAGARSGISAITVDGDLVVRKLPPYEDSFWRTIVLHWQEKTQAKENRQNRAIPAPEVNTRIRYFGKDHSFKYVSYYQALDWKNMLAEDSFKNKIVLIGLDMRASPEPGRSQADTFATPYLQTTGWLTPGVELEATFVANGILNRSLTETPQTLTWFAILFSLLLSFPGILRWRPGWSLLLTLCTSGSLLLLSVWLFAEFDLWFPCLAALVAPLLLYLIQGAWAFVEERKKRRQIEQSFAHYVSPTIVKQMIRRDELPQLGGSRRKITLMFTDLAGFTHLSEQKEPEQVAIILNRHFSVMTQIILSHGGTIDKFIGDAIMAFWGAPLEDEQQALHAAQAAIEMQASMCELRQVFEKEGLPPIHMRIGIHTGIAVVGNMGSTDRFDYTALGDSVNLAARLEGINKLYGTGILLSSITVQEISQELNLILIDKVKVKGKAQAIEIYSVLDLGKHKVDFLTAIEAYRQRQWPQAETAWRALAERPEIHPIAEVYLSRINNFKAMEPASSWDGSVSLDKM